MLTIKRHYFVIERSFVVYFVNILSIVRFIRVSFIWLLWEGEKFATVFHYYFFLFSELNKNSPPQHIEMQGRLEDFLFAEFFLYIMSAS